jgi:hypothetical protein
MSVTPFARQQLLPALLLAFAVLTISRLGTGGGYASILKGAIFGEISNERSQYILTQESHPRAGWPRGAGHILLSPAGTTLAQKGYHEPGGSFSPGFRSFGVSLLVFDGNGFLQQSSNSVPLGEITQDLNTKDVAVRTEAKEYIAEWFLSGPQTWTLQLELTDPDELIGAIRVSSAGPSGAPITRLYWDGERLIINDSYVVRPHTKPSGIVFSDERLEPAMQPQSDPEIPFVWHPPEGYGSALLMFASSRAKQTFTVGSIEIEQNYPLDAGAPPRFTVDVPDNRFIDSLQAQLLHIKAGIVEDETRPGDPGNYDLAWLRDGAYVLVTLARTGHVELAKTLAHEFATKDFFGGFGAEADGPGLAIWALDEIASRSDDLGYEQWAWPHIERKARIIVEMIDATEVISKDFVGPVVPRQRGKSYEELAVVAGPARDGLISGVMDGHRPIFYVNGVSYLGLTRAALMADRLGMSASAEEFASRARDLRKSWQSAFPRYSGRRNARTAASALWPTGIARGIEAQLTQVLSQRWHQHRSDTGEFLEKPIWTYFDVAEAHQWLLLGDPERSWLTLEWFWANQASAGLYTWWEGAGEENSSRVWESARGWANPEHVTPHYWTAAEVALLQLDMLAYDVSGTDQNTIIIGAGIPAEWLDHSISVTSMPMRSGELGWFWDGKNITISWRGARVPEFRKGPAFPASSQLLFDGPTIEFEPDSKLSDLGL